MHEAHRHAAKLFDVLNEKIFASPHKTNLDVSKLDFVPGGSTLYLYSGGYGYRTIQGRSTFRISRYRKQTIDCGHIYEFVTKYGDQVIGVLKNQKRDRFISIMHAFQDFYSAIGPDTSARFEHSEELKLPVTLPCSPSNTSWNEIPRRQSLHIITERICRDNEINYIFEYPEDGRRRYSPPSIRSIPSSGVTSAVISTKFYSQNIKLLAASLGFWKKYEALVNHAVKNLKKDLEPYIVAMTI